MNRHPILGGERNVVEVKEDVLRIPTQSLWDNNKANEPSNYSSPPYEYARDHPVCVAKGRGVSPRPRNRLAVIR